MKPIKFQSSRLIPATGEQICTNMADTDRWSEFTGYGMLPGIKSAAYEVKTDNMLGSRIRVLNTDGSQHVEEIYEWIPGEKMGMKFQGFTPPLSNLASHFTEEWVLQPQHNATLATRKIQMVPKNFLTLPMLWLISLLFRQAIEHNMDELANYPQTPGKAR